MPFEAIENRAYVSKAEPVPSEGLLVKSSALGGKNGRRINFISIWIGAGLSKSLGFHAEDHGVNLLFGNGRDAGKVCVSADNKDGLFRAKRNKKSGNYRLTINARSAEGRFALTFPTYAIQRLEAVKPENGGPRQCVFPASPDMLRTEAP